VTLDLDTLRTGTGVATTSTGDRITAEQARRLACQARIIPVVLGRKAEVLDLGRSARLFSRAQRKALAIRDKQCTTEGCNIPADTGSPRSRGGLSRRLTGAVAPASGRSLWASAAVAAGQENNQLLWTLGP